MVVSISHLLNQTIEIAQTEINGWGQPCVGKYTTHNARIEYKCKAFRNKEGNEVKSEIISFSTKKDVSPPIISQVKADSTLFPGREEKVQTIISWKTDEPSLGSISYQEGVTETDKIKLTSKDVALKTDHFVVITKFKPNTVYKFFVESEDIVGNKAKSKDFTTLTPQKQESVIQLIIRSFEDIFGWTKNLRF